MADPGQDRPTKKTGGRKRTTSVVESSEGSRTKRVKNRNISDALRVIVDPIYARSTTSNGGIPNKNELQSLHDAVQAEGEYSEELKEMIKLYIPDPGTVVRTRTPSTEKGQTLLRLAASHERNLENMQRLTLLKNNLADNDNKEIINLVQKYIRNDSRRFRGSGTDKRILNGSEYVNQQLEKLNSGTADLNAEEIGRIQAFLAGKNFKEIQKMRAFSDILEGISKRTSILQVEVPLQSELEEFLAYIEVEDGTWGESLKEIVAFHAFPPPRPKLPPSESARISMNLAKQFKAQSVSLAMMESHLNHENNKIICKLTKRWVEKKVASLRFDVKKIDSEHHVVDGMQNELNSPTLNPDRVKGLRHDHDAIKIFIDKTLTPEQTSALENIAKSMSEAEANLSIKGDMESEKELDALKQQAVKFVESHNILCQQFKAKHAQKANEFVYFLEEIDPELLWNSN